MSSGSGQVGGGGSFDPAKIQGNQPASGSPTGGDLQAALHTKVSNLGELKSMLTQTLGEKDGKKMYDQFMKSFLMIMLTQMQQSAKGADQASKQMGQGPT